MVQQDWRPGSDGRALCISREDWHNNRGPALERLGQLDAAVASYDQAIKLEPANASAWTNHGNALVQLRRLEAAVASYDLEQREWRLRSKVDLQYGSPT